MQLSSNRLTGVKTLLGGFLSGSDDFREIGNVSRHQEVWCSEVAAWASEYRVYVLDDQILSVDLYAGSEANPLDRETVEAAVSVYTSGEAPSAYGIDWECSPPEKWRLWKRTMATR